jgi:uncharacterized repeat protein (TIGR03803 family)
MRLRQLAHPLATAIAFLVLTAALTTTVWGAPKYEVLHAFGASKDGAGLYSGLALDRQGNVYGTTSGGGPYGYGTVFQLTPHSNGTWTEAILHSFKNNGQDGDDLNGGLILDAAGSLYGTATLGGGPYKYGTIFKLTPGLGGWTLTVLHRFGFNKYGCCPQASLVMDNAGNLFGTAGAAFELSADADGWKETLLHDFTGENGDGFGPYAGVILDAAGNVYGTTERGGSGDVGIVYRLRPSSGGWKESVLHSFGAFHDDGQIPGVGALVSDASGNLYGTTSQGGRNTCVDVGCGTVFKLTPGAKGDWKETILYNFTDGANGAEPDAGVVMDKAGNLYGTTSAGGSSCGCGLIYKLAPGSNGKWTYTVLHRFTGYDGAGPNANLILDDKGNLYGTTTTGGAGGYGVAFQLTP